SPASCLRQCMSQSESYSRIHVLRSKWLVLIEEDIAWKDMPNSVPRNESRYKILSVDFVHRTKEAFVSDSGTPQNKICTVFTFPPFICHEITSDYLYLTRWNINFR
ncbi:unnamed protein product, partial [Rangifer tarandus platyrhynchus]